jgi:hypothetical protein
MYSKTTDKLGFELYLIEIQLFERKEVYGYDDIERFLSFQIATLD